MPGIGAHRNQQATGFQDAENLGQQVDADAGLPYVSEQNGRHGITVQRQLVRMGPERPATARVVEHKPRTRQIQTRRRAGRRGDFQKPFRPQIGESSRNQPVFSRLQGRERTKGLGHARIKLMVPKAYQKVPEMPLQIQPIPAFETNYIWALHDDRCCAIVDPGSATEVLEYLDTHGLNLCAVLLTHHHHDHIGGVDALLARHPVAVWGPRDERMPQVDRVVAEGDQVRVPELQLVFQVLETPGHTLTHIVLYDAERLLAGDTLFSAGCGRLFEGTPAQMQHSLDKLARLDPELLVYCAHEYTADNCRFGLAVEPDNRALQDWAVEVERRRAAGRITLPTRLGDELAINPFLRTRKPAVIAAAQAREPESGTEPAEVFGVIRRWKDSF